MVHDNQAFTSVQEKNKSQTTFSPEHWKLNREVIVETAGPIPPEITHNQILQVINNTSEIQQMKFQCVSRSASENVKQERNINTPSSEGPSFHQEIALALDILNIQVAKIYANSRWSRYVINMLPATIGT